MEKQLMEKLKARRPSPALLVAVVALVAALGGGAVAGVTVSKLNNNEKKQVKKISKKQAKKLDKKIELLPGPQGEQGPTGPEGPPGPATGPAGGDLTGTYPNPLIAGSAVNGAKIADRSLGTAEFANSIPVAKVYRNTAQSIPNSAYTPLAFGQERYDTDNMHSTSTNNSRIQAPVEGIYQLSASVQWSTNSTGARNLFLVKNGSTHDCNTETCLVIDAQRPGGASVPILQHVSTVARLDKGDYVEAVVYQSITSGNLNVLSNPEHSPEFSMTWLAPGP